MANIARVLLLRTNESDPPYVRLWHICDIQMLRCHVRFTLRSGL
jgi:hypothetical protein